MTFWDVQRLVRIYFFRKTEWQKTEHSTSGFKERFIYDFTYKFSLLYPPGWYVVWQLFLSKFKFLRELVGDASTPQAETQPSETKSERAASASTRTRPRTARQRVASPESTS